MEINSYLSFISSGGTSIGYIALDETIPLLLNFDLEDFKNIGVKKGNYSKPVKIPGSKESNRLFSNIFSINSSDWSYNVNKKQQIIVVTNGVQTFNGYLQLTKINQKSRSYNSAPQEISYDCVVFDSKVNFLSELDSKLLTDLDLSQYDHVLNDYYTQETTGNTWQDAYVYPMLYSPSIVNYKTTDFKPAIYAMKYLEQMQIDNQFTLTGNIFNDEQFQKLIIPYNGETPKISEQDRLDRMFQASVSGGTTFAASRTANSNAYTVDTLTAIDWYFPTNFPTYPAFPLFGKKVTYNNDSDGDNFDTTNNFDISTNRFTSPGSGSYDFSISWVGLFTWESPTDDGWLYENSADPALSAGTSLPIKVLLVKNRASITNYSQLLANTLAEWTDETVKIPQRANIALSGPDIIAGMTYQKNIFFSEIAENIQLGIGDTVEVVIFTDANRLLDATTYWDSSANVGGPTDSNNIDVDISFVFASNIGAVNRFKNTPYIADIQNGDTVRLNDFIPKQYKQSTLLNDLFAMHNVYMYNSEENERELICQTRETFYSGTSYLDWSRKFETDKEWNLVLLSDLQTKRRYFKYKDDSDVFNKNFLDSVGYSYGTKEVVFDNEYLVGDSATEVGFSPTPLIKNGFNIIVPAIDSITPKNNIRILYYEGMKEGSWTYNGDFAVNYFKTSYPYAGHFGGTNAPQNPSYDLNWSINDFYYYNLDSTYTNSLYDRYWDDYIDFIANGKLLTAFFNLTEKDINEFRFNKKIWIDFFQSYFYVNKIIDFNASSPGLTKVELHKIYEGNKNRPRLRRGDTAFKPQGEIAVGVNPGGGNTSGNRPVGTATVLIDEKGDNNYGGGSGVILGNENETSAQSKGYIVQGDNNTVKSSDNTTILGSSNNSVGFGVTSPIIIGGSSNEIYGPSTGTTIIGGSGNFIDGALTGLTIIGTNNLTITSQTQADAVYVGGVKISNGVITGAVFSGITIDGYMPISGGTFTGGISGTSLNFSGPIMSGGTDLYSIFSTASSSGTSANLWSASTGSNSIIANNSAGNIAEGNYSQVLGGVFNKSVLEGATVVSGVQNTAYGQYCLIFGGSYNSALTINSVVVSGTLNKANANFSFIGAGNNNEANATYAFVGAGSGNKANALNSFVGAGSGNTTSGLRSAILNGSGNTTSGVDSVIIGGFGNSVTGNQSAIIGGSLITGTSNSTVYVPNLEVRTNMVVSGTTDLTGTVAAKGALNVSGATSLASTAIVADTLSANGGVRFEISGGTHIWKFKSYNIGGWDMDTTVSKAVLHGLSATEWKTIRSVDVMILNDAGTLLYPLILGDEATQAAGYHNGISSTQISVGRITGGVFDGASYNDAGINRGFISFWYIPD